MHWPIKRSLVAALVAITMGSLASSSPASEANTLQQPEQAMATLQDLNGNVVGTVIFTQMGNYVDVSADVNDMPAGFHGFHVHTNGVCDPSTQFTSAGGHFDIGLMGSMPDGVHAHHAGDMTNLYVMDDGTGGLNSRLDHFTIANLTTGGARSVMVHADPDNFYNIPDRYGVTVDQMTFDTGDAGPRIACGVIQRL